MNYKGIITKLEFKAILYLKGFSKNQIVDIINMQDYFSITYVMGDKTTTKTDVNKLEIYEIINNHSKALMFT